MRPVPLLIFLSACAETGVLQTYPIPELTLEVTSPTYGAFVGASAVVTGKVSSPETVLRVEGERVPVQADGSFLVPVPLDRPYRILEITAELYGQSADERIVVFQGTDPAVSWPGGVAVRVTDQALSAVSDILAGTAEALFSEEALTALLPPVDLGGTLISTESVSHDPISVTLTPSDAGLTARFAMNNLQFNILAAGEVLFIPFEIPASLLFPELTIESVIQTRVDDAGGIVLGIGDPVVGFEVPEVTISALGFGWLSDLLLGWLDLGQLITDFADSALGGLGDIPLGPPIAFSTDLLGTSLELRTSNVVTDADGLGIVLGVGLNEPAPTSTDPVPLPAGEFADPVDLSFAVHEGLIQVLLESDLLSLIEQDLMLPSFLGGFLGNLVKQLPGGEQAPDAYGWCVNLELGEPKVARFHGGPGPLMGVYLPDATVRFGTFEQNDSACTDWLVSSIALELLFNVTDGTKLSFDLAAPEGKVLSYGATGADEAAVVQQLGTTLTALLGLVGGLIEIDLAEIFGADALLNDTGSALGLDLSNVALEIRGAQPMVDAGGAPIDGLWEIGMQLFDSAPAVTAP